MTSSKLLVETNQVKQRTIVCPLLSVGKDMEKDMATHSSVLAWRIPEMEEPGGLPTVRRVAKGQTRLSD